MERHSFALGGFRLKHSQAVIDADVQTSIDVPGHLNDINLDSLVDCWVQRGRILSLCLKIESNQSLSAEQLEGLTDNLATSEVCSS